MAVFAAGGQAKRDTWSQWECVCKGRAAGGGEGHAKHTAHAVLPMASAREYE